MLRHPVRRRARALAASLALAGTVAFLAARPATAQDPVPPPQLAPPDTTSVRPAGVSPGGAFLRSVLVPGWGHASIGSSTRAGFYFVLETTSIYGLVRTRKRIADVRGRAELRESTLRADLEAQGVTDPQEIESALEDDATLEDLRGLEESRLQQQEDWLAFGIFLLFLAGADAYVSAHLKDFPTPIDIGAAPVGDGRMEIRVGIAVGR